MTWLITGGCGFVGANLADALLALGEDVVILDNLSRLGSRDNLAWLRQHHAAGWRFVEADIRNAAGVAALVKETRPYAIAHLAGQVAMTTSLQNPRLDFEINAIGTMNVLEAVRLCSPDTIVSYSSTNKVYGDLDWAYCIEEQRRYVTPDYPQGFGESIPLSFHSPYGCSKGAADQYVLDYSRTYALRTVVFRHSSMYGGRQFATFDQGWVGWFCQKALETQRAHLAGQPAPRFTISGNGKQVRDVLHSQDLVRVYQGAVKSIDRTAGQAYNIGGGMSNSLSLLELFSRLEQLLDVRLVYDKSSWRQSDQKVFVADTTKASRDFGWSASVSTDDGIASTLEWLRQMIERCHGL